MTLDLSLDPDERLLADAVERFCAAECVLERARALHGGFDRELWRAFCAQGFLELGAPDEPLQARLIVVLAEVLGRNALPGPLADTLLALQLVSRERSMRLLSGDALVSVGVPPRLSHACDGSTWLALDGERVHRLEPRGPIRALTGVGAEEWGEADFVRVETFEHVSRALFVHDLALAAQLTALAHGLVQRTAEHAAMRKQFNRPIGSFQAVSHPLADAHIALTAASTLARAAACACDADDGPRARVLACGALVSASRAALQAAYTCHQKLGALGITLEGPAHHVSRRIRSLATRSALRTSASAHALLDSFGAAP